jgi:Flp pilus assembly protein TadG
VPATVNRDEGSSAIELVLLTPVLIALVFAVVQAALLWNAQHATVAAAQQGARFARTAAQGSDPARVQAATTAYLHSLGANLVDAPTVTVHTAGGWTTVTVTAHAVSLLPGATLTVHGSSRGPVETFMPDTGGSH